MVTAPPSPKVPVCLWAGAHNPLITDARDNNEMDYQLIQGGVAVILVDYAKSKVHLTPLPLPKDSLKEDPSRQHTTLIRETSQNVQCS